MRCNGVMVFTWLVYMSESGEGILKSLPLCQSRQRVSQYAMSPWHVKSAKVKKEIDGNQFSFLHLYSLHRYSISIQDLHLMKKLSTEVHHRLNSSNKKQLFAWHWPTHLAYFGCLTVKLCMKCPFHSWLTKSLIMMLMSTCQNWLFCVGCKLQRTVVSAKKQ